MPAFYHRPQSVEALVDFVVGKILDSLGIDHALFQRWGEGEG
jgi:4-hydroxy-3-polyprenylbenzoate decarboxylase